MQIHIHEVKILQIHNAKPEFVTNITAINQSESSILIKGVIIWGRSCPCKGLTHLHIVSLFVF